MMKKMGSLGWSTRSQIPSIICRSFNKMEKNERFLGQLKSGAGAHIIKLSDIRGETIKVEEQTLVQHILIKNQKLEAKSKQKI